MRFVFEAQVRKLVDFYLGCLRTLAFTLFFEANVREGVNELALRPHLVNSCAPQRKSALPLATIGCSGKLRNSDANPLPLVEQ